MSFRTRLLTARSGPQDRDRRGASGCGSVRVREGGDQSPTELEGRGSLDGIEDRIEEAERAALSAGGLGRSSAEGIDVAAVALGSVYGARKAPLVVSVVRWRQGVHRRRELLGSLAAQAVLALENVELHFQVKRQAVTDELTGRANHGRFQELLQAETDQVRRYHHPVGLIMLDIDDFKSVNDTYGHQQGDSVLRAVARVLRANSRDADSPARYGGEEMALILPHTDLEGAHAIAERVRMSIEALHVARIGGRGTIRTTASFGVAATTDGDKNDLIARADAALYQAKRAGKNRTVRAPNRAAEALSAE